jgi:branched chain amino acid efflux pump
VYCPGTVTSDDRHQLGLAIVKTLPFALGIIPFGLVYGVLATGAGLTVAETVLMSLLVFAGASQLTAVVMLQSGAGIPLVVASTFLINLRHLVMGLSISPYFTEATPGWRRVLAFAMCDEAYLLSIGHFGDQQVKQGNPYFMLGSGGLIYVMWAITSLVGAIAGHAVQDPLKWGLDFAMPATFLTLLVPQIVSTKVAIVVAASAAVATTSYLLIPGKWYIILAVLTGTFIGVMLETVEEKRSAA